LKYKNGYELVKELKIMMKQQIVDRGFAIANTSMIDLNAKLELFKNGMDYYITKPYDLFELSAII
jgi:DNA-binding response OmpR family regulator